MEKKLSNIQEVKPLKAATDAFSKGNKKFGQSKILNEFKTFVNRGNVMDLAVGVVVGGAFSKIVTSLVNDIIMPVVSLILGGVDFTSLTLVIPNFFGSNDQATIAYGNFIQNVVDFLIIAFCIFLFVRTINKIQQGKEAATESTAKKAAAEAKKGDDEQIKVMKEILSELKKQNKKK